MTPHDAEEQLRPVLGALHEAEQTAAEDETGSVALLLDWRDAALDALDAALDLLGVRR